MYLYTYIIYVSSFCHMDDALVTTYGLVEIFNLT